MRRRQRKVERDLQCHLFKSFDVLGEEEGS